MTREDARGHLLEEPVGDGILEKELREFVQAEDLGSFDDKIKLLKLKQMFFWEGTGLSCGGGPVVIKAIGEEFGKYSERMFFQNFEEGFLRDEQFVFLYSHSQWVAAWAPPSMALMQQGHGCTRGFSQHFY